jgi:hypothetical protein
MMIFTKTGSADIILLEESFEGNDIPESWKIDFSEEAIWLPGIITELKLEEHITEPILLVSATYESNSLLIL